MLFLPSEDSHHGVDSLLEAANKNGWLANISESPIQNAFSKKGFVHAGVNGKSIEKDEIPKVLEKLHSQKRQGSSAVYVHLPYCETKCLYCGFFGGKYTKKITASYLDALLWEIDSEQKHASTALSPIHALYLGGGTPTALRASELKLLLNKLRFALPLANDCEITVEGRVHNFGQDKMEACLEAGANRFSFGVQTFNTKMRQMLGRIEAKEEVIKQLERLASYNQAAIVIDLIYGLPGQSLSDWQDDIKTYLDLALDGVDLYKLNVFKGSALEQAIEAKRVPNVANLAEQTAFFTTGIKMMEAARFRRLSMSHWGRDSRERNRYNPLAKSRADCLNLGASAGGYLHNYFMFNEPNADLYIESCKKGIRPIAMLTAPPDDVELTRSILSQMETCKFNLNAHDQILKQILPNNKKQNFKGAQELFAPLLENWEKAKLIIQDEHWVELTLAGQFWQINITQALLGWQRLALKEA